MEGAAGAVILAGFPQFHPPIDHIDNVDAIQQVIDEGLGDSSGHKRGSLALKIAVAYLNYFENEEHGPPVSSFRRKPESRGLSR